MQQISSGTQIQADLNIPQIKMLGEPKFTQGEFNIVYLDAPEDPVEVPWGSGSVPLDSCYIELHASPDGDFANDFIYVVINGDEDFAGFGSTFFDPNRSPDAANLQKWLDWLGGEIHYRARLWVPKPGEVAVGGLWAGPDSMAISTQDTIKPTLLSVNIPENNPDDWYKQDNLQVEFQGLEDEAGIDTAYLYYKGNDDFIDYANPDSLQGDPGRSPVNGTFSVDNLDDGYWTFTVGARDAAYTPDSHGPGSKREEVWKMEGNKADSLGAAQVKIDTQEPTSNVDCNFLLPFIKDSTFDIKYTCNDPSPGSGVACIELWYIKDGGDDLLYAKDCPPDDTIKFKADCDGKYEFYTIAIDNAGNREPSKSPECNTFVDVYYPLSKASSPDFCNTDTLKVSYSYHDSVGTRSVCEDGITDISEVKIIWLWWKKDKDNEEWQTDGAGSTDKDGKINFPVPSGDGKYYFYTVAEDIAGNVEPAPPIPDDSTIVDRDRPDPPNLHKLATFSPGTEREICWDYVDSGKVDNVWVECSSSPEFEPIIGSSGWLPKDSTCFTFDSLKDCKIYWYRGKTKRLEPDSSWESSWSDSVFSTQDTSAPVVVWAKIREDKEKFEKMWYYNNNTLHIDYRVTDSCAGISKVILYLRHTEKDTMAPKATVPYYSPYPKDTTGTFEISLDDGRYELKLVVLDAANIPDSSGGPRGTEFVLEGNKGEAAVEPEVFTIDTQPPDAVTVPKDNINQVNNTMVVEWKPEWPKDNPHPVLYTDRDSVGFRGYEIRRRSLQPVLDDPLYAKIATIYEATSTYVDSFPSYGKVPVLLAYSIWPFDSLGNKQDTTLGDNDTTAWYNPPPPPPYLYPEPEYTRGDSNVIYWSTVEQAYTYLVEKKSDIDSMVVEVLAPTTSHLFADLKDCVEYSYRVWACAKSGLISDTSNVDSSTQDTTQPEIKLAKILKESTSFNEMCYYSDDTLQIEFRVKDTCAGISKVILQTRNLPKDNWNAIDSVNYLDSFPKDTTGTFKRKIDNGRHEFKLVVSDASYTPESPGPSGKDSVMDGNKNEDFVKPKVFTIDTQPPDSVTICNIHQVNNTIEVKWDVPWPKDNPRPKHTDTEKDSVGFKGFVIKRECLDPPNKYDIKSDTIVGAVSIYVDAITDTNINKENSVLFAYSVLPFDKLGNKHHKTMGDTAWYYPPPPPPDLCPEPEYTPGTENTICWIRIAQDSLYTLEIQNDLMDTNIVFTSDSCFTPDTCCYTATNLTDGEKYNYRVKAIDKFGRETGWSDSECSIQDATPPTIHSFLIPDSKPSQGKQWVYTRNISLRLEASDQSPGKLCYVVIWE
ncbi:hypothetical protein H8E88_13135, partial [candidate division KSB1 bacterium]|nr:hypothetical protein [candidate division KSB1 bacterium]